MVENCLKISSTSLNKAHSRVIEPSIGITTFLSHGRKSNKYFLVNTTMNGEIINELFLTISSKNTTHYTTYILTVNVLYSKTGLSSFTSTAKVSCTLSNSNNSRIKQSAIVQSIAPKSDISASAGLFGWAISFSGSDVNSLYYTIYKSGYTSIYAAIVAYIVEAGISGSLAGPLGVIAGIVGAMIISIGFYYLYQYDQSNGNPGVYFAADWANPLLLDIWGLNPIPWYY
ncbi:MAG: hypothetical protein ACYCSO_08850 [Cuniculiplasma sp.]